VNQKIMVKMLERLGYQVSAANDGFQAVEAAKANRFDIILMDVHMPACSGLEATIAIREFEREQNIHTPIIAVTASVADELSCLNAGMDDFISKPISKTFFLGKLEKWVRTL
jgi:CheY-like chemotaxis protein